MDVKIIIVVALALLLGVLLFSIPQQPALGPQPMLVFAQGGRGQIALVNPASGKMTRIAVGPATHGVSVLPDGTRAYAASFGSDEIVVIDLQKQKEIDKINIGGKSHHIEISPDGRWVYVTVGSNNTVAIIETNTDTVAVTPSVGKGPTFTTFTPKGDKAYVTSMQAGLVSVFDTAQHRAIKEIAVGSQPDHLAITADGRFLYVVNRGSNDVSVIDTMSDEVIATISVGKGPHGVAVVERQGRPLAFVGNRSETTLSMIDITENRVIETVNLGVSPEHLAASLDRKYLYIGSLLAKSLFIFDVEQGRVVKKIKTDGEIHQIAVVPSSADQRVQTVQIADGAYFNVGSEQLYKMLQEKDFWLVNVHIPYEGELPQTDLFVPYNEIEKNLDRFPSDKSAKMVLYCKSGRMSAIAAEKMVKLGFTNVWNLKEGMNEWENKRYPLLRKLP